MNDQSSNLKANSVTVGIEQWYADLWRERWNSVKSAIEDSIQQISKGKDSKEKVHFLIPSVDHGLLSTCYNDVLCYLNRRIEIRLLPYHDTVLIEIPFGANIQIEEAKMPVRAAATQLCTVWNTQTQ